MIVTSKNGQNATGDWADFNVKENQVVLGGDVILTQDKNVVRGSKLTIDMLTGESVIHTDPGAAWSATAAPANNKGALYHAAGHGEASERNFLPSREKGRRKEAPERC